MYDKLCPTWENAAGGSLQINLFQAMIKILPQGSVLERSQRIICLLGSKPDTNRIDALRDQQQLDHRGSSKL